MQLDALIEISRYATLEASKALSKFVSIPVSLGTVRSKMTSDIFQCLQAGSSEPACVISGSIVGDAKGLAILCLPLSTASGLCDLLFKREFGNARTITPEEEDALIELGNIVVGNYLRAFARAMPGTALVHRTARVVCGASPNLITDLMTAWQPSGPHKTLLFEVTFEFRHAALTGCVMIVLEASCVRTLLECASTT